MASILNMRESCSTYPPLMLKDFLKADLSSCSSSGFDSYPRCTTTVRFLLHIDLLKSVEPSRKQKFQKCRSRSTVSNTTTISVLQRATEAVINAVKQLPFHFSKSPSPSSFSVHNTEKSRRGILPRSFSQNPFKRSFKKKPSVPEIKTGRSFGEFLEETNLPSNRHSDEYTVAIVAVESTSGSSNRDNKSCDESDDSEFSVYITPNDAVESIEGSTLSDDNVESSPNCPITVEKGEVWINEEKQQPSPVSILDCPFKDEEITSPLTKFASVGLEKRMALLLSTDEPDLNLPSIQGLHKNEEINPMELLNLVNMNSLLEFTTERLLLDFFIERLDESEGNADTRDLVKEAEEWVNEESRMALSWEVEEERRKGYVKEMEKGYWIGLEVEVEVFNYLVDEVLVHLLMN